MVDPVKVTEQASRELLLKADPKDMGMGLSTFLVPCCSSWPYLVFVIIFPDSRVVSLVPKPA